MSNLLDSLRTLFKLSGTQALPSLTLHSVIEGTGNGDGYITIASPIDGWVSVGCLSYASSGSVSKVRAVAKDSAGNDACCATASRQVPSGVGVVDNCMPVCKGQSLSYSAYEGVQYRLAFFATKGSD